MGKRMNWSRARKAKAPTETRSTRRLERQADKIITAEPAPMTHAEYEHSTAERVYYRSVGSVMERDGRWLACDGFGQIVGEFPQRWLAWQLADKFGLEIAGALP